MADSNSSASARTVATVRMRFGRLLIPFLLLLIAGSTAWAAPVSETATFKQLLNDIHDRLTLIHPLDDGFSYHDIFTTDCEPTIDLPSDDEIFREQSFQTSKISGLEFRGAYVTGMLTQGDDDEGGLERGRGNLELSWDILKQGYRQNTLRAEAQTLEARQAELRQGLEVLTKAHRCRRYQIKKEFTNILLNLLNLKLRLMEPVYQVERRAYFKHWSFLDDYLVSEEDMMLTTHELNTLLSDPYYDSSPVYRSVPPILDVNLAGLLTAIREDNRYDALLSTEKERLKKEHAADIRDSLRLYLRKEFDVDGQNQDDILVGLRFRVPLYSRKNDLLKLSAKRIEREKSAILRDRIARSRNAYTEMQEQLRRTIRQHYRYSRTKERLRRTLWQVGKDDESYITTAITRMRTLIETQIELVRAIEELYRTVNEIFLAAQIPYRPDLLKTIPIEPERLRARFGTRSIYVWSEDFNGMENNDLLAFLEAKQISTVLLSAGRKTDTRKRDQFLEQLTRNNIAAELIVGDNSWIFRENHEQAVARSVVMAEKTGHLHFDIEPQAMSGYQENRQDYLALFINLVKKTKTALMDRTLGIAVPFHWPDETYRELGVIADKLYVMAYGTENPEVLIRRISPLLRTVPSDQLVVVLRADDFQDEWAVEQMIERIISQTGVERFAIQDLGDFFKKAASGYEIED